MEALQAKIDALNKTVTELQAHVDEDETTFTNYMKTNDDLLDVFWLLFGTVLVFYMQAGFALLEAGGVSAKNTKNILLKNILDACIGGLVWWSIGYPMAFGEGGASPNAFAGGTNFFMYKGESSEYMTDVGYGKFYAGWMFQWAFAAAAATIVSGSVAERCNFHAYLIYTTFITAFVYPIVVHWAWSTEGWLSPFRAGDDGDNDPYLGGNGFIDFAGSGVIHMVGGGAALMGAIFVGPRCGRFNARGEPQPMRGHSTVLQALGTFILWFGWYGFNPVSTLDFAAVGIAARVAVCTTLSACTGGLTVLFLNGFMGNVPDVGPALNGILAGLVGITAPCAVVEPWAAGLIGVISAFIYYAATNALLKLQIDDVLEAAPVHFFCGMWACISVGLFATDSYTNNKDHGAFSGNSGDSDVGGSSDPYGVFYGSDGGQLGTQILGVFSIAAWTCGWNGLMFFALSRAGILRVSKSDEMIGLDESHHGGSAYDMGSERKPVYSDEGANGKTNVVPMPAQPPSNQVLPAIPGQLN